MRIGTSEQIAVFLKDERRIKLGGSSDHKLRRRSHMVQQRTRADCRQRLSRSAVSTKHIVSSNAPTAKTAIHCLYLDRLIAERRRGHSVAYPSRDQLLEMICKLVSQLARGSVTILGLVLHGPHQDQFHLTRDRRRYLAWSRVLREVEDEQRIVLRIGSGQQVKHRRAQTVDVRSRLHSPAE